MNPFQISQNVELGELLATAENLNFSQQQTIDFLATAIDFVRIKSKRVFAYTDPVDSAQPAACRATFARSFVHSDWIDGESVVQAETTTLEEGFNSRFHKIERDLDALAADIAQAFVCLGGQRAEVARALEEVKTEINRINSDVFECCDEKTGTAFPFTPFPLTFQPNIGTTVPINPNFSPNANFAVPMAVNPNSFRINPAIPFGPGVTDPVRTFIDSVSGANAFNAGGAAILRSISDPNLAVISGMPARLIEENSFNGNPVDVWSTAAGLVLVPRSSAPPEARTSWINPRIEATGRFAQWVAGKSEEVTKALGSEFTVAAVAEKFGEEKVEGGVRIADLLAPLAGDTKVASPNELVAHLAESNAKEIVREGFASETVIGAVGLNAGPATVAEAPVDVLKSVDKAVMAEMVKAGIGTVGQLAEAAPEEVSKALKKRKIAISAAQVAAISAQAATVVAVDRSSRAALPHG